MERENRARTGRRNVSAASAGRGVYIEGNMARQLQEMPARRTVPAGSQPAKKRTASAQRAQPENHKLSRQAQRNRERALDMNFAFVVFIVIVSAAVLMSCITFLRLRSQITGSMKTVAVLEAELTQLREDNDAYYSQVSSDVDLNRIRKIAFSRLGMMYPSDDQTITYQTSRSSYLRQYQDLPDSK